jgi:VWFA-related protein
MRLAAPGSAARRRAAAIVLGFVFGALAASSQGGPQQAAPAAPATAQEPTPPEAKPRFGIGTAKVVLDVVVRDKKGRPVVDLRPEEVSVLEDGVLQKVEDLKLVESAPVVPGGAPAAARPDASRQIHLVTLVFDRLGPDGRRMAQKAAAAFLEKGLQPNTWMSVFRVDERLAMVAPFTNDRKALEKAVSLSTSGERTGITDEKAALSEAMSEIQRTQGLVSASGPSAAGQGGDFASRAQAQALANMLRLANDLQRQQLGTTSLYPLLALMKGQQTLAGRKTLVYLTERLEVPPNLDAVFRSVISEANRANVSVYAIDARGLDTTRAMESARDALLEAQRVSQQTMENEGAGAVSKAEIRLSETAESALRANVEGVLQELAEGTGGFLISNTNNFKPGAERIATDIAAYYELSYTPPPSELDGRFHAIEVKVARKDVTLQSRSGYFALPPGEGSALFPYEVPLLGALSVVAPPKDFALRMAALRFGDAKGGRDHKLIVEVPIAELTMKQDQTTGKYALHFSLMATIKDKAGAVVERYSEDYPFEGPIEKADALRGGNIVFKRRLSLAPGQYTVEAAGQDRMSGKVSTRHAELVVPAAGDAPKLSSLALIRRVDDLPADTKSDDPLDIFNQKRIVPNLDAPISAAVNPKLWLFFLAYPRDAAQAPSMSLEFVKEGRTIARADVPLPKPDPDGIIRYIGNFPTERFSQGSYQVNVSLNQGGATSRETTAFTIVP